MSHPHKPELVGAEPLGDETTRPSVAHLAENRRVIIERSLLATTIGGLVPLPILDDWLAARVRAGLMMALARKRGIDLPPKAAEVLGDPTEGTAWRNATITAATLVALKLAWRKFFALLAVGRRAEEMATSFQIGTLFDHYAARLHVGAALDRTRALRLRLAIHEAVEAAHRETLVGVFKEGASVLGRSLLEAPAWVSDRMKRLVEKWVRSGGRADAADLDLDTDSAAQDAGRFLDKAAGTVEGRLLALGTDYLVALVGDFERRYRAIEAQVAEAAAAAAAAPGGAPPDTSTP